MLDVTSISEVLFRNSSTKEQINIFVNYKQHIAVVNHNIYNTSNREMEIHLLKGERLWARLSEAFTIRGKKINNTFQHPKIVNFL
jgi:hypothetical protein